MNQPTEPITARLGRKDETAIAEMQAVVADPVSCLLAAARGNIEAQRKLALAAWARAVLQDEESGEFFNVGDDETLEAALIFARLAAAHGAEQDVIVLANWLSIAADMNPALEPERMGEAIAWVQREADAGSERAAKALNAFVEEASVEAAVVAQHLSDSLNAHLPSRGAH